MAVIPLPLSLLLVAQNSFFCQSARTISLQFRKTADYRVCWRRKKEAYQQAPLVQASPSARSGPRRLGEMEQKHCLSPGRLTLIRLPHVCLHHLANTWFDTVSETTWIVQLGSWIAHRKRQMENPPLLAWTSLRGDFLPLCRRRSALAAAQAPGTVQARSQLRGSEPIKYTESTALSLQWWCASPLKPTWRPSKSYPHSSSLDNYLK